MSRPYTEAQLTALRILNPADDYSRYNKPEDIAPRTMASLKRRFLVAEDGTLTKWGLDVVESYVRRTGDGPERLKAMLRF